jgi:glutamate/tyrosine decarboxylase-like PLP-dependent enzyme
MSRPLPFLRWALRYMEERAREDADAPVFGVARLDAATLSAQEREMVESYPARGREPSVLRAELETLLDRHVANGRSPRFLNQLFSGVEEEALAGSLLGMFPNNTMSTREVAPVPSAMESAVIDWLRSLLPWDAGAAGGTLTPAGSFSNYLAVFLARKAATGRLGADSLPKLAVFTSEAAHSSIPKGADLCGVRPENVVYVAADHADRMRPHALEKAVADARARGLVPFFVNATLGTTVAGALDPVPEIARIAGREELWLHVDGAWGALGFFGSDRERYREAVENADSLTWDAHKGLGAPVALSFLMVRDRLKLDALRPPRSSSYLFHRPDAPRERADLGLTSLYCGKPFLALSMWLLWKSKGEEGLREHVDHAYALTGRFRDLVRASPLYEVAHEPETWVVCFRPQSLAVDSLGEQEDLTARTRERINASGRWMLNLCPSAGGRVFRAIFVNPLMTEDHVDELLAHLEACHPASS